MDNEKTAPPEQPWYETCDLYDFVGSCEATMTEAEKREYRNYLRDLDKGGMMAKRRVCKKDKKPAPMTDADLEIMLHWLVAIHKWGKSV